MDYKEAVKELIMLFNDPDTVLRIYKIVELLLLQEEA